MIHYLYSDRNEGVTFKMLSSSPFNKFIKSQHNKVFQISKKYVYSIFSHAHTIRECIFSSIQDNYWFSCLCDSPFYIDKTDSSKISFNKSRTNANRVFSRKLNPKIKVYGYVGDDAMSILKEFVPHLTIVRKEPNKRREIISKYYMYHKHRKEDI